MNTRLWLTLLGSVSALATIAPAMAQAGAQPGGPEVGDLRANPAQTATVPQTGTPTDPATSPADTDTQTITVTGTRLITNGNNSPTPVTVLPAEQFLKLQPTTITEAVNLLPALQGSQNVTSNSGGGQRNGAGAYFNLRNLGDLRTLVLVDGMRLIPTINQNEANVDAGIVPQLLIKRVDVVTGGVSAVYGSDAISGVINFVTDRDFNGIKLQATNGISTYGDDNIKDVGIAAGTRFAGGRGHLEASYQFHDDPGLLHRADRPFFGASIGGAGLGTAASPYYNIADERISNTSFGGLITGGPLANLQFTPAGTLAAFNPGTPTGTSNRAAGGDGGWYSSTSIKSAIRFHQAFARGDYDLTDDIHAFVQGSYSSIHTANNYQSPNVSIRTSYANPYLSSVQAPYSATIAAQAVNPANSFVLNKIILNEPRAEQQTDSYTAMAGLEGKLGAYKWQVGFQHAQSVIRAANLANIDAARLYAAADAVRAPNGQIVCRASLTNGAFADCVPLNLFGQGSEQQAALDYITRETYNINRTRLDNANASIAGAPFETWAGPVNMAVSGEWRKIRWDVRSNTPAGAVAAACPPTIFTTAAGTCVATGTSPTNQYLFNVQAAQAAVSQSVWEVAYEADVPLLRDSVIADALNVSGAVRYTDYDTSGSVWTWKVGGDWNVRDFLKLRATRSRDIRAPNLFSLYLAPQVSPTTWTDLFLDSPLSVNAPTVTTANPNLTPEKANTLTLGGVFKPAFLPGFSLSIDYFRIKVDDVIFRIDGKSSSSLLACRADITSPVCALVARPLPLTNRTAANAGTTAYASYLNIASLETHGVDFEANYHRAIRGRPLDLRALVSYQPKLRFDQGPAGVIDLGNSTAGVNLFPSAPAWKATGVVAFQPTEGFTVTVLERWRGRMKVLAVPEGTATPVYRDSAYNPAIGTTTLNLAWTGTSRIGDWETFVNVQNVFNAFPEVYYPGAIANPGLRLEYPSGDDFIGRYFTVGFKLKI